MSGLLLAPVLSSFDVAAVLAAVYGTPQNLAVTSDNFALTGVAGSPRTTFLTPNAPHTIASINPGTYDGQEHIWVNMGPDTLTWLPNSVIFTPGSNNLIHASHALVYGIWRAASSAWICGLMVYAQAVV